MRRFVIFLALLILSTVDGAFRDELDDGATTRLRSRQSYQRQLTGDFVVDFGLPYYHNIPWTTLSSERTIVASAEVFTVPQSLSDGVMMMGQNGTVGQTMIYQFRAGQNKDVECYLEHEGRRSCIHSMRTTSSEPMVTICINPSQEFTDMSIMCKVAVEDNPDPTPNPTPTPPFSSTPNPTATPGSPTAAPTLERCRFPFPSFRGWGWFN